LKELGAEVIGVSVDDHKTQCDFAASVHATFPMIGDSEGKISKLYGVLWPLIAKARRITFVIDREGIIAGVLDHELMIAKHLDETLALLRKMPA
jgi:alkyl hydroperoxide reductase subunit AhpC